LKGDIKMMNEEIMVNELIEDTTKSKGLKVAGIISLTVLGGLAAYKYVIKPVMTKIKIKKEQQMINAENDNFVEIEE
jgi:hypothetical protein